MRYVFKSSFDRSIRSLQLQQKDELKGVCIAFIDSLEAQSLLPCGLGLKRLHDGYWEIRHGLRNRILFRWKDDLVEFVLAGDHDTIKGFLKNYR